MSSSSNTVLGLTRKVSQIVRSEGVLGLWHRVVRRVRDRNTSHRMDECRVVFDAFESMKQRGVMVDVGAHVGGALRPFAERGWDVLAFEPDSRNRAVLEEGFGGLKNVRIDPRAIGDRLQDSVQLFRSDQSTGISTLAAFHDSHTPAESVEVVTLEKVCEERHVTRIDFLKIDAEGFDLMVLKGVPWSRVRPTVVVCEFEDQKTVQLGYSYHDLAGFLVERGYEVLVSEWKPIVRYGGNHTWKSFRRYPCELAERSGWGNLIATSDARLHAAICLAARSRYGAVTR